MWLLIVLAAIVVGIYEDSCNSPITISNFFQMPHERIHAAARGFVNVVILKNEKSHQVTLQSVLLIVMGTEHNSANVFINPSGRG